jgi:UDPglucose 6-dehydrogenase
MALIRIARDAGSPSRLVETVVEVNDARKSMMAERILAACGGSVQDLKIGVLGLTFKPETDDMREAPSVPIVNRLVDLGAHVRAFDPQGIEQAKPLLPSSVTYCRNVAEVAEGADALVLITEWNEFRALSPSRLKELMRGRVIVDLRNVFDPVAMRGMGFQYHGIGRF